jgi:integrase
MKLTTTTIRSLALPPGQKDKTYFDDDVPGFGLRLREGGSRKLIVQYDFAGKTRRLTLGSVSALDLGKARERAKDLLAAVRLGRDPAGDRQAAQARAIETFGALLPRYLAHKKAQLRPGSYREVERHLLVHAKPLHPHAVDAISHRAVAVRLAAIAEASGRRTANLVRASLSAYFAWLMGEGMVDANPVSRTNKAADGGNRDRVLAEVELREILGALEDDQFGAIVRLLALTGQRRAEIGDLRWSEVDLDAATIELPAARTKNKHPHQVPLAPAALAIVKAQPRRSTKGGARDLIFGFGRAGYSDWSKAKLALDRRIAEARKAMGVNEPMQSWRLHDLRRTMSTVMHDRLGVQPHIVEAVLNHASGHKAGVAGVYNYAAYEREKRVALELWAEHVTAFVEGRDSKVVALQRA